MTMTMSSFSTAFFMAGFVNAITAALFRQSFLSFQTTFSSGTHNHYQKDMSEERGKLIDISRKYLPVYLLAVFSDWVKGPYAYGLYSSDDYYHYDSYNVFVLCSVLPFVSSLFLGTFLCGPIADNGFDLQSCGEGGRKQMAMVFALVTLISNLTKHVRGFQMSVLGSILDGISTSLLFTNFDSWLVSYCRGSTAKTSTSLQSPASPLYLSHIFALAEFGNNAVAILASWMATQAADANKFAPISDPTATGEIAWLYVGGLLNPFDLSSFSLFFYVMSIRLLWNTNFKQENNEEIMKGLSHQSKGETNNDSKSWWRRYYFLLTDVFTATVNSKEIMLTGTVCSLYESAMFIFVFNWTNVVASRMEKHEEIPFDIVFATFMFGCMTGTTVFTILISDLETKNDVVGKCVLFTAVLAFLGMIVARSTLSTMVAFFLFELSVGMYFPMMATLKSEIVPENHRTTICNAFRVPFNLIMVLYLWWSEFDSSSSYLSRYPELPFVICVCLVGTACILQTKVVEYRELSTSDEHKEKVS